MKRVGAVIVGIVVGLCVFAIGASVVAALLAAIVQTGWSPPANVSITLGLLLDCLKWAIAIWSGYRAYKYLMRKPGTATALER